MLDGLKAWWRENIVPRFYKAYSWLGAMTAMVVTFAPEVANFVIDQSNLISLAVPELSTEHKVWALLAGNAIVAFVRPIKQPKSMGSE